MLLKCLVETGHPSIHMIPHCMLNNLVTLIVSLDVLFKSFHSFNQLVHQKTLVFSCCRLMEDGVHHVPKRQQVQPALLFCCLVHKYLINYLNILLGLSIFQSVFDIDKKSDEFLLHCFVGIALQFLEEDLHLFLHVHLVVL